MPQLIQVLVARMVIVERRKPSLSGPRKTTAKLERCTVSMRGNPAAKGDYIGTGPFQPSMAGPLDDCLACMTCLGPSVTLCKSELRMFRRISSLIAFHIDIDRSVHDSYI